MKLYPAILTESLAELKDQLSTCQAEPTVSTVQIDIIDGFFADAVTVSPLDLLEVDPGHLQFDLHLMTTEPQDFVFESVAIKRNLPIRAMIGQVEQMSYPTEFISEVKTQGWLAGLSLNLYTPIEVLEDIEWHKLDVIQLMGVEAGSQGQNFNQLVFNKIAELKPVLEELDHPVELIIDGGVKLDLVDQLRTAGVDSVAVGSAIWESPDRAQTLADFIQAVA